jgi:glycosyltransferase involved in cell wall biosynthesis
LLKNDSAARILAECDAVVALTWPPFETPLTPALAGMAAGKPVVAMEIEATAHWPALDPQTWRPRGLAATAAPIAVTIEPRDEEHSLMLAMRRLATDLPLREQLGHAAHTWWQANATPAHAAAAWNPILEEAGSLAPPLRPSDWPKHLGADGTELARAILNEFGLTSDI